MTVEARVLSPPWQVEWTAGEHFGIADTAKLGLGGSGGPRPHELLEAAVAACMTITTRMELAELGIADRGVAIRVELVRKDDATTFNCLLMLPPEIESSRATILDKLEHSPVRTTLTKPVTFKLQPGSFADSSSNQFYCNTSRSKQSRYCTDFSACRRHWSADASCICLYEI